MRALTLAVLKVLGLDEADTRASPLLSEQCPALMVTPPAGDLEIPRREPFAPEAEPTNKPAESVATSRFRASGRASLLRSARRWSGRLRVLAASPFS